VISRRTSLSFHPLALAAFLAALLAAPSLRAQTRWDASLSGGVSTRVFSGNPNVAGLNGSVGPIVGLAGDVSLIPLLRLGLYGDYEYADTGEPKSSSLISAGARLKLMIPGYRSNVHWWLFTGFGGVLWLAPAYTQNAINPSAPQGAPTVPETVSSATGYFAEIPLGLGVGWRARKPWEIIVELQARFGFAMNGSYFTDDGSGNGLTRPATTANGTAAYGEPTGTDVVAFQLTVGLAYEGP
jgi:hypothetical protein